MNKMKMLTIVSPLSCAVGALTGHEIFTPLHELDYGFEHAFNRLPEVLYLDHPDGEIYQGPPQETVAAAGASHSVIGVQSASVIFVNGTAFTFRR
jgi:hypothetical protein